jgi:YesN/AraC family two-component response regulator
MLKIMIVDDQEPILESLRFALEDDYEVVTAQSGEECLTLLDEHKPDLIMTDYRMAGLNGIQLLEAICEKNIRPAVILYSAFMTQDIANRALSLGASECLSKPFDVKLLKQKLSSALLS